ncbi:MAG TPA: MdtA/MuxA family multidrug efflux RND transporter periplasmic adaptor subunit [Casimicrobiaceae bacterium]|jgi:multidrug efflux system membrane fusion protein|nr:MdtA/MuxA family multidrug efflux RND transporter periplasmic adaptor subunit [Casimicrobiaceae bacterium]
MAAPESFADPLSRERDQRAWYARRSAWLTGAIVLVMLIVGLWWWLSRSSQGAGGSSRGGLDPNARGLPVVAAPVTTGSIDIYLSALGTVTPRNMVTVRSRVDGQLMEVAFREGQLVRAGDLLAQIDPRPFEVQLTQAQGQLAKDEALLRNAQLDLERYRTLLSQDSISKQQVDTQESLVHQYEGTVKSDQGQVDNAKLQLTYSRVTAPIGGVVGLRQVDPGNIIHASDTNGLVVITQLQPITVLFPIPEDDLQQVVKRIKSGASLPVEAWDRAQKVKLATGKLLTLDNQIDTATGTVKLRAEFPNDDSALFPNQFVNVRMLVDTRTDATLVPSAAIQRGAPGTFVYAVSDDKSVSVKPLKLGPVQGEITAVESGIAPGTQVVVDGADKLREGSKVELITREARNAPAAAPQRPSKSGGERRKSGS